MGGVGRARRRPGLHRPERRLPAATRPPTGTCSSATSRPSRRSPRRSRRCTAEAKAVVLLVCDGPEHETALPSPADVDVRWLHRSRGPEDAALLADAVRDLTFPQGRPFGFVHGEADEIRAVRHHLLHDRGLTRQDLSCSPYWRRTMTDEAWRQIKRDYVAAMEAEAG